MLPFTDSNPHISDEGVYSLEDVDRETIVEVDYDLTPLAAGKYQQDQRIERVFGTLYFEPDEIEKQVHFKIFKRQYFEEDPSLTKFHFNLRFGAKGA